MDLLIATNSVLFEKADKAPSFGVAQYATDGNPAQSILATIFPAYHYNTLMSEIVNAIIAGGVIPDRNHTNQLASIITKFRTITEKFDKAITLKTVEISQENSQFIADFNTENNVFHGWLTVTSSMEINRPNKSSNNCLMFSYNVDDKKKPSFYVAADDINLVISAAGKEDSSTLEPLLSIDKTEQEMIFNGKISSTGADFAEYFQADANTYITGQVMMIGGDKEITLCTDPKNVFGIYSTQPGFVLNNNHKNIKNNIPIATNGRVPVLIEGPIKRGDRITPTNRGTAIVSQNTSDILIGRSIKEDLNEGVRLVECYVRATI